MKDIDIMTMTTDTNVEAEVEVTGMDIKREKENGAIKQKNLNRSCGSRIFFATILTLLNEVSANRSIRITDK